MAEKPTYEELVQRVKLLEKESFERKRAEEDLRHEKKRLESLIKYSSLAMVSLDGNHNIISCNRDFTQLFGFQKSDIIGINLDELIAGQEYIEDAVSYTKKTFMGKAIRGAGKRRKKNGDDIDVEIVGVPVIIDGKLIGAYGIYRDISDRNRAEEALRESKEKYRTVLESNPDPVVVYDMEGRVLYLNLAFTRVFGWSLEEQKGKELNNFVPEENWPETKMMIYQVTVLGESFSGLETRRYTKNGNILDISISGSCYRDHEGNIAASVINLRDITEQKKLQRQLQQAQKMEAIGTLAGGIAHDFNNLLAAIKGRASITLMSKDSSHPDFEDLRAIEDHVNSAADLTRQLLGFARGGKYDVRPTDLNELITKENRLFGRTKKEITIHEEFEENLWSVEIDRGQIEQVLLNLYVNAWQAMPEGGDLYLRTKNVIHDKKYVKPFPIKHGRYVEISVTDTGIGMEKATQEKIFDPFFTTKEMGRGTGLGLASSYGIIQNHGGFINVYSEKGHGTTFTVYLPVSEKEAIKEDLPSEDLLRGTETVLFVDDEDIVVEVAEKLFNKLGYKVLIAKSGKEAIEIYKKNQDQIDIVLLDMIMPDVSGSDTFDKLREINQNIKVLLSSGYSLNGKATEILNRGCNGFVQKPFRMKELSKKMRKILDGK